MWEIFDFKVISATENSNKFQKTRFWKEKSVEHMVTLESLPFNSIMISLSYLAVQKIDTYIAKQCSHVEFPYFVMGSHLNHLSQSMFTSNQFDVQHNLLNAFHIYLMHDLTWAYIIKRLYFIQNIL
jgi:hypothetical protein